MNSTKQLFTIGHSNHSIDAFIKLLQQHGITAVADVRSHPYSRYLPHFNKSELEAALQKAGIEYRFLGQELGARPNESSCYVDGKALYEKIAETPLFIQGIKRLVTGVKTHRIALMCAERDPITCHRSILVCQHLRSLDIKINHILNDGNLESHKALEERLLKLHGLKQSQSPQVIQLSLFETSELQDEVNNSLTPEERLQEAYQRQGDKIAYVEKEQPKHD
jgi:uncharacterized protein (DUF488 family)